MTNPPQHNPKHFALHSSPEFQVLFQRVLPDGSTEAADPDVVTFYIEGPDNVTHALVYNTYPYIYRTGEGAYRLNYKCDDDGKWNCKWSGEGTIDVYTEDLLFMIDPSILG